MRRNSDIRLLVRLLGALACAGVLQVSAASAETVVYAFKGGSDGFDPAANLTQVDGLLYGTTLEGGGQGCPSVGCGTVFSLTPSGTEQVVYAFKGGSDAAAPGSMIDVQGTLYGVSGQGGGGGCTGGCGTIFSIAPNGIETVLYAFKGGSDGALPGTSLININGTLYGTTLHGGGAGCAAIGGCGTVFSLAIATGQESVLYPFKGDSDGELPTGLVNIGGTLYGTTLNGGVTSCNSGNYPSGCGTVFSINRKTGTKMVLYAFGAAAGDGDGPWGLSAVDGTLYGTTLWGGAANCNAANLPPGCGAVFSFSPATGIEKVVYSFGGQPHDGTSPQASLIEVGGKLYGTTNSGGGGTGCEGLGCGTVFSVDPATGSEQVLHRFWDGTRSDGAEPAAGLISVGGLLYGTVSGGPARPNSISHCGAWLCGAVFSITP